MDAELDTDELNKDVTLEQRGIMQTMIHPVHAGQVLRDWLSLTAQAVAEMKREGVL